MLASAATILDLAGNWEIASSDETYKTRRKRVYYLSLEIMIRRLLIDALTNMEMIEPTLPRPATDSWQSFQATRHIVARRQPSDVPS